MAKKQGIAHSCVCGDHVWAPLTKGFCVLVSPEDENVLRGQKWWASVLRRQHVLVYAKGPNGRALHLSILKPSAGEFVDHASRDALDNRRSNLRLATRSENGANHRKRKNTSSRYIGVTHHEGRVWQARIQKDGKAIYLGLYPTEEEAALAYRRAAEEIHGVFAAS